MSIMVAGIHVPIIDTVNVEGTPPTYEFLWAGNFVPEGYTINWEHVAGSGAQCGQTHQPKDTQIPITNDTFMHAATTGFINGGFIDWRAIERDTYNFHCTRAYYGDDNIVEGYKDGVPAHGAAATYPAYTTHTTYYMAAIKVIYSVFPSSPVYMVVVGLKQEQYNDNGSLRSVSFNPGGNGVAICCPAWERRFGEPEDIEEIPDEEEDPEEEPSGTGGYGGTHDPTSDPIGLPNDPAIGVTNAGFINVYNPTIGGLSGLGDEIFPSPQNASDIIEAVVKLCQQFAYSRLIDYIIDCHVIPCAPTTGNSQHIKVGFVNTTISAPVVTSDYVNVSCGSLSLAEFFGNFADYSLTTAKLWLPFVGFVDVKPEFWQAGTIYVDYKFNIIDGSFMAYVRSTSSKSNLNASVIASYGGNACMHFPITGVNYANMASGLIGAAATMSSGKTGAVGKGAFSALEAFSRGGDTQQSNGFNSTSAILGIRTPYLIIERVSPSWSALYQHDKGIPSNVAVQLSLVSGYTEIEDIDLTGIPLTKTETDELKQLLTEGVYF